MQGPESSSCTANITVKDLSTGLFHRTPAHADLHPERTGMHAQGFQDPSMNSFCHTNLGTVAAWAFRAIGGLRPLVRSAIPSQNPSAVS